MKWDLNNTWDTIGCLGKDRRVGEYEIIKLSENKEINRVFPMNISTSLRVRNGLDPYLVA